MGAIIPPKKTGETKFICSFHIHRGLVEIFFVDGSNLRLIVIHQGRVKGNVVMATKDNFPSFFSWGIQKKKGLDMTNKRRSINTRKRKQARNCVSLMRKTIPCFVSD